MTLLLLYKPDGSVKTRCCACRKLFEPSESYIASVAKRQPGAAAFICPPCAKADSEQMKRLERTRA